MTKSLRSRWARDLPLVLNSRSARCCRVPPAFKPSACSASFSRSAPVHWAHQQTLSLHTSTSSQGRFGSARQIFTRAVEYSCKQCWWSTASVLDVADPTPVEALNLRARNDQQRNQCCTRDTCPGAPAPPRCQRPPHPVLPQAPQRRCALRLGPPSRRCGRHQNRRQTRPSAACTAWPETAAAACAPRSPPGTGEARSGTPCHSTPGVNSLYLSRPQRV